MANDGTNSAAFTLGTNGLAFTLRLANADSSCPSIVASTSSSCSHESGAVSLGSIVGLEFSLPLGYELRSFFGLRI